MKIFCQMGNYKTLSPKKGDSINEIGTLMAFSQFAEVYYSGSRFLPGAPDFGLKAYDGSIVDRMKKTDYDLYYVRDNAALFMSIPQKKPKIWFASPFNASCFKAATLIATPTRTWATWLKEGRGIHNLNPSGKRWRAEPIYQTVSFGKSSPERIQEIRRDFGADFVVGSFGRITNTDNPYAILNAVRHCARQSISIVLAIGINNKARKISGESVWNGVFPHNDMSSVYNACDVVVASHWGASWDFAGSLKTMEAAFCGIPVILGDSPARRELFGDEYPLFVPKEVFANTNSPASLVEKILFLINNREKQKDISRYLFDRASFYSVKESGKRLKLICERLI